MPFDIQNSMFDKITDIKISHLHASLSLSLDGVVRDARCCCVIAVHGDRWLRVAELFESESDYFRFFYV